jgi:hypothetical protein
MESPVPAPALTVRALALLLAAALPSSLAAQSAVVSGSVVYRAGSVSRPVPRQWTYLHEIRGDSSRAADSARTDGAGRYRVTVASPDTAARYVVATQYAEVDYFSQPLILGAGSRLAADPIFVYDTTSGRNSPAMRLDRRLFAVFRAATTTGGRSEIAVQEMVEVANPGERTRIATDTTNPVWTLRLPAGVGEWEVAEGDITPDAMWLDHDTLKVFAPIWPGAPLRASYRYTLASRAFRVPFDQWTGELNLLVEDTSAALAGVPLERLGTHELEGRRFAAYRAGPLEPGAEIQITLARGPLAPEDFLPYVVALVALGMVAGLWFALRRKSRP